MGTVPEMVGGCGVWKRGGVVMTCGVMVMVTALVVGVACGGVVDGGRGRGGGIVVAAASRCGRSDVAW